MSFASIEDLMGKSGAPKAGAKPSVPVGKSAPHVSLSDKMHAINLEQMEAATKTKATELHLPYVNLKGFPITPEALRLLPQPEAERLHAVPFLLHGEELRIAALDPTAQAIKDLAFQLGESAQAHAEVYLVSSESFAQALKLYATLPVIKEVAGGVEIEEADIAAYREKTKTREGMSAALKGATTTDVVTVVLAAAIEAKASDIHIEAEEKDVAIRLRLDGVLQTVATLPPDHWKQVISRIKLVAGLKLNIATAPQDGRFTIFVGGQKVDVRTSTLPTAYGESVVMRLLMPSSIGLSFETIGLRGYAFERLKREVEKPHGMILTTGPTGSGKTTTLYAILQKLNTPDVKIITLEDPVEYKIAGLNQSQIDHSKHYDFADGLRSILRQDPDIVMVGEIRDRETADVAVQAALTGHLLLSTIHTNNAAGAVPRFLSMGVDASLLAPALRAVIGQRLVRKLCTTCRKPATLSDEMRARVEAILAAIPPAANEHPDMSKATFFTPGSCDACRQTGYKGRMGVYEILTVDPQVESRIRQGSVSDLDMQTIATAQGMITMEQDGILKAMDGITDVEEVFRVAAT